MRTRQSSGPGSVAPSATIVPLRPPQPAASQPGMQPAPQPGFAHGSRPTPQPPPQTRFNLPPPVLQPGATPAPSMLPPLQKARAPSSPPQFAPPPVPQAAPMQRPRVPLPMPPAPAQSQTEPPAQGEAQVQMAAKALAQAQSPNFDPAVAHDVQLGQIFTNMRLAMKVSRETIARRLATSAFIIEAFETGTVSNLPHWRETARIVRGYCDLLRLDPEPILWRIKSHYHASGLPIGLLAHDGSRPAGPQLPPADAGVAPQRTQAQPVARTSDGRAARRRRRRRSRLLVLSAPVLLAGVLALSAQRAPDPVYAVVAMLPEATKAPLRAGFNALVDTMAPVRDGLRWVELSDPQLRKSDKLQTSKR